MLIKLDRRMIVIKEGFYHLSSKEEPEPILVHCYKRTDLGGQMVLGFNTHDGGGLIPVTDLADGSVIVAVEITEIAND